MKPLQALQFAKYILTLYLFQSDCGNCVPTPLDFFLSHALDFDQQPFSKLTILILKPTEEICFSSDFL